MVQIGRHSPHRMTDSSPLTVSVIGPLKPAMERVKDILFRPFNFEKWISIAFCTWLAGLTGGYPGFNFNYSNHQRIQNLSPVFQHAKEYVHHNLSWILPASALLLIFFLALAMALLWLSSRGQFMLLHCVALNRGEVTVPWKKFSDAATSLWHFRLLLLALSLVNALMFAVVIVWCVLRFHHPGHFFSPSVLVALIPVGLVFFLASLVLGVIRLFTTQFVVPIMFLRGGTWSEGWNELLELLGSSSGQFFLYLLFQIVFTLVIFLIVFLAVLCTCCIAGILLLVPFVGTVVYLPITIFTRSYQLHYLAQYGAKFDVFKPESQEHGFLPLKNAQP